MNCTFNAAWLTRTPPSKALRLLAGDAVGSFGSTAILKLACDPVASIPKSIETPNAIMTNRFRITFSAESLVVLHPPSGLFIETRQQADGSFGSTASIRTEYVKDRFGTVVPGPLSLVIEVDAPEINEACARAQVWADVLVAIHAVLGRAPVSAALLQMVYQAGPDDEPRPFVRRSYAVARSAPRARRHIDQGDVGAFVAAIDQIDPSLHERIFRVLRALRRAFQEEDALDRALLISIGFEALNPMLVTRLGVDKFHVSKCDNCGHERRIPSAQGVLAWLSLEYGAAVKKQYRDLRNGYVHGFENIGELTAIAVDVAPTLEQGLIRALAQLLGLDDLTVPESAVSPEQPFESELIGQIAGPVEAAIAAGQAHPRVEIVMEVRDSKPIEDETGKIKVEYTVEGRWTGHLPPGVQLVTPTIRVPHDPELERGESFAEFIPGNSSAHGSENH